jgi:hypothetical protein
MSEDPAKRRLRRELNPDFHWEEQLRKRYNLTKAEYDALFERQGGLCIVCKRPESCMSVALNRPGMPRRLAVDHDARVGRTRGLLCSNCNLAIGHMADDPARLRAAADYLEEGSREVTDFLQSFVLPPKPLRKLKSHCPRGHPYSGDNLYIDPKRPGARRCKACSREQVRNLRKNQKSEKLVTLTHQAC